MSTSSIKISKKKLKPLSDLKLYKFDSRYMCNGSGDVYLIKEDLDTHIMGYPMAPFTTNDGYVEYVLTDKSGNKKHIQAHRIVAGLYLEPVTGKDFVNHKDGNKKNNHYTNLKYTTVSENIKHTFDKLGRKPWNLGKKKS